MSTPPPTDKYDPTFATTKKSMPDVCTGYIFGTENEAGQSLLTPHYQDRKNYKCCLRCTDRKDGFGARTIDRRRIRILPAHMITTRYLSCQWSRYTLADNRGEVLIRKRESVKDEKIGRKPVHRIEYSPIPVQGKAVSGCHDGFAFADHQEVGGHETGERYASGKGDVPPKHHGDGSSIVLIFFDKEGAAEYSDRLFKQSGVRLTELVPGLEAFVYDSKRSAFAPSCDILTRVLGYNAAEPYCRLCCNEATPAYTSAKATSVLPGKRREAVESGMDLGAGPAVDLHGSAAQAWPNMDTGSASGEEPAQVPQMDPVADPSVMLRRPSIERRPRPFPAQRGMPPTSCHAAIDSPGLAWVQNPGQHNLIFDDDLLLTERKPGYQDTPCLAPNFNNVAGLGEKVHLPKLDDPADTDMAFSPFFSGLSSSPAVGGIAGLTPKMQYQLTPQLSGSTGGSQSSPGGLVPSAVKGTNTSHPGGKGSAPPGHVLNAMAAAGQQQPRGHVTAGVSKSKPLLHSVLLPNLHALPNNNRRGSDAPSAGLPPLPTKSSPVLGPSSAPMAPPQHGGAAKVIQGQGGSASDWGDILTAPDAGHAAGPGIVGGANGGLNGVSGLAAVNGNAPSSFTMTASPLMGPGMASPALPYMSDWFQASTPTLSGMSPYLSASAAAKIAQQQQLPPAMKLSSTDAGPHGGAMNKKRKVGEQ